MKLCKKLITILSLASALSLCAMDQEKSHKDNKSLLANESSLSDSDDGLFSESVSEKKFSSPVDASTVIKNWFEGQRISRIEENKYINTKLIEQIQYNIQHQPDTNNQCFLAVPYIYEAIDRQNITALQLLVNEESTDINTANPWKRRTTPLTYILDKALQYKHYYQCKDSDNPYTPFIEILLNRKDLEIDDKSHAKLQKLNVKLYNQIKIITNEKQ